MKTLGLVLWLFFGSERYCCVLSLETVWGLGGWGGQGEYHTERKKIAFIGFRMLPKDDVEISFFLLCLVGNLEHQRWLLKCRMLSSASQPQYNCHFWEDCLLWRRGDCPLHCRMFNSISGLYILDANSIINGCKQPKILQMPTVFREGKIDPAAENPWHGGSSSP